MKPQIFFLLIRKLSRKCSFRFSLFFLSSLFILSACQSSSSSVSYNDADLLGQGYFLAVTDIVLSHSDNLTIQIGEGKNITADVLPKNSPFQEVYWENDNTNVVSLSVKVNQVTLIPIAVGDAVITASVGNKSKSVRVTIKGDIIRGISLNTHHLTLTNRAQTILTASIYPPTATNQKIIWSVKNPINKVVAGVTGFISNTTLLKATDLGEAEVTVTTEDGGWKDTVTVTVRDLLVTNLSLNTTNLVVRYREKADRGFLSAAVLPPDALNKNVEWKSSDPDIAVVTNGVVYPIKSGEVTITAVSEENTNFTAAATVTILADWVVGISYSPSSLTLQERSNATLTASVLPTSALDGINWLIGDNRIATLSNNGNNTVTVTGVKVGNTIIMASAGGRYDLIPVTVKADFVTGVSINPNSIALNPNSTGTLTTVVTPITATNKKVVWKSENTGVATVLDNGDGSATVVAGNSGGRTLIWAIASGISNSVTVNVLSDPPDNFRQNLTCLKTDTVDLAWDALSGADRYEIYRVKDGIAIQRTNTVATSFTETGLTPNTYYTYEVKACAGSLCSSSGSLLTATGKSAGNDLASIIAAGTIPNDLNNYDESAQAIFGGYSAGAGITVRYVLPNGTGNLSGSSWDNAISASGLRFALNQLTANINQVVAVLLGPGVYRTGSTLTMRNYAAIVGRVSGCNNIPSNTDEAGTTLSGNNSDQVFANTSLTSTARLYGITIANGNIVNGDGGGMKNDRSSPTLIKVVFLNNSATTGNGGGMYNDNNSSPTLTDVMFSRNSSYNGGGIYNNNNSSPTLTDVTFSGNTVTYSAGGMFNDNNSSPTLTKVILTNNVGNSGTGGMYNNSSSPILTEVSFFNNKGTGSGGMFNGNNSSPVLTKVIFSGNMATSRNAWGGGMLNSSSSPVLTEVIFSENTADSGGGMYNYNSSPILTKVVFSGNISSSTGGGMAVHNSFLLSSFPVIANSIFWGNRAGGTDNQIYLYNHNQVTLSLYNSIVEGGMPAGYASGAIVTNLSGGGFSSGGGNGNIVVNFSGIISTDPGLGPLADNGGGIDTMAIPTTSSAVNQGLYVKRNGSTHYYSINNTDWFTTPALTTAVTPAVGTIDLTVADMTGTSVNGRPDIGVYEAR